MPKLKRTVTIEEMDADRFCAVADPKLGGVAAIASVLDPASLDFLVVFSSTSAIFAPPHQAAYAAANGATEALGGSQLHARLRARLAHGGREQVPIIAILASTRKRDLPRPRVTGALGALDQEDLGAFRTVHQHQGHRRGTSAGRFGRPGVMAQERPEVSSLYARPKDKAEFYDKRAIPDGMFSNREHYYKVIVVDAFSSDAIPIHLITREAIELYFSKLAPDGVPRLGLEFLGEPWPLQRD